MPWQQTQDPHRGGIKIPFDVQDRTQNRILAFANQSYAGRFSRISVRFQKQFCYLDAFLEPIVSDGWPPRDWPESREAFIERLRNTPKHLCRMRYFGDEDRWSLAFYKYSTEAYAPCFFHNNTWFGTPEEALDVGSVYLDG